MAEILPKIHYAFVIDGETIGLTVTDAPVKKLTKPFLEKIYCDASTPVFSLTFSLKECRESVSTFLSLDEGCIECHTLLFVNDEKLLEIHERNKFLNPLEGFWSKILSYEDMDVSNIIVFHRILSINYSEPIILMLQFVKDTEQFPKFLRIQ